MRAHNCIQGSEEWHALRAGPRVCAASDAPAMMGASKYKTRNDLLREKATGIRPEVDSATQRRFNEGHRAEAEFRPYAEVLVGDELPPKTGTVGIEDMTFLASFDGLTKDRSVVFEHKLWSRELAEMVERGELGPNWYWQLEHQLLVSGADQVLFVTSDGTLESYSETWYRSVPERRARLIAGWRQFLADLDSYEHRESPVQPAGRAPESLPALRVEVTGMVTASNLDEFRAGALAVIGRINMDLDTDEDFADAEKAVKWCKDVEDRLEAAKQHALSQTASIDALFRTLDEIREEARQKRLSVDRLVKQRKESIRAEILTKAQHALREHCARLNARIGGAWMPAIDGGFPEAIRNKRTIASLHDAVDTALAHAKIAANEIADRIEVNHKILIGDGHDWLFLFPDFAQVARYEPEAFAGVLASRIRQHEDANRAAQELAEKRRQQEDATRAQAEQPCPVRAWAEPIEQVDRDAATVTPIQPAAVDPVEDFLSSRSWSSKAARTKADYLLREFVQFTRQRRPAA